MQTSALSDNAHDLLVTLFTNKNFLLIREPNKNWLLYNHEDQRISPLDTPELATELLKHKLIEHNDNVRLTPPSSSKAQREDYDYTFQTLAYLERHIPLVSALLKREEQFEGAYTLGQVHTVLNLAEEISATTNLDFHSAFVNMNPMSEGEIYQHKTSGRWRIFYEDDLRSVPVRAAAVKSLLEEGLLVRTPGLDDYYAENGYGNCHTLSEQGTTYTIDAALGCFNPKDFRFNLETYFLHLGNTYGNKLSAGSVYGDLHNFGFTELELNLFLLFLHKTRNPQLAKRDEGMRVLSEQLSKQVEAESSTVVTVQTIRQLAGEAAKHVTR